MREKEPTTNKVKELSWLPTHLGTTKMALLSQLTLAAKLTHMLEDKIN
jgi:hypothetical protein